MSDEDIGASFIPTQRLKSRRLSVFVQQLIKVITSEWGHVPSVCEFQVPLLFEVWLRFSWNAMIK